MKFMVPTIAIVAAVMLALAGTAHDMAAQARALQELMGFFKVEQPAEAS
jgi:hypothetical protein